MNPRPLGNGEAIWLHASQHMSIPDAGPEGDGEDEEEEVMYHRAPWSRLAPPLIDGTGLFTLGQGKVGER